MLMGKILTLPYLIREIIKEKILILVKREVMLKWEKSHKSCKIDKLT